MDIEKRVSELTERWFSSFELREIMAREVTALIREAVEETHSEWKAEIDGLEAENEGCLKRQGLRRINHITEADPTTGFDVVDFWIAPPPGHILTDDGVVRKVLGSLPLTADGCVATINGTFFTPASKDAEFGDIDGGLAVWAEGNAPVGKRRGFTVSYLGAVRTWQSNECYSTREAAIAASSVAGIVIAEKAEPTEGTT